jgi:hypothetical protein
MAVLGFLDLWRSLGRVGQEEKTKQREFFLWEKCV